MRTRKYEPVRLKKLLGHRFVSEHVNFNLLEIACTFLHGNLFLKRDKHFLLKRTLCYDCVRTCLGLLEKFTFLHAVFHVLSEHYFNQAAQPITVKYKKV